ncbi:MAG: beta strand repeat-containing protein, partial [Patescibacteria group bacterium]
TSAITALTGTPNYVARWTDANTIGTGILYDSGTSVGIGTNNPTAKLHVFDNSVGEIKIQGVSTNYRARLSLYSDAEKWRISSNEFDLADALTFSSPTTERMRITAAGNVGIGDTSPASLFTVGNGDLFQVDSSGNLVKINNVTYSWPGSQGAASTVLTNNGSGTLTWGTIGSTGITADSLDFTEFQDTLDLDANLILNQTGYTWTQSYTGTTGPGLSLTASGAVTSGTAATMYLNASSSSTTVPTLTVNNAGTGSALTLQKSGSNIASFGNPNVSFSVPVSFEAAGDTAIAYDLLFTNPDASFIRSNAPLAIISGAPSSNSNLTLQGTGTGYVAIDDDLYTTGNLTIDGNSTLGDASGDSLTFNASTLSVPNNLNIDSNTLYIDSANNRVGVGTASPATALEVAGTEFRITNGSAPRLKIFNSATEVGILGVSSATNNFLTGSAVNDLVLANSQNNSILFGTNGDNLRMVITGSGNVGIGSTSPSQKLDVTGGIRLGAASANNVLNTAAAGGAATGPLYWGNTKLSYAINFQEVDGTPSVNDVTTIKIDQATGLHLYDEGSGTVRIAIGSHWKDLYINGVLTLTPSGEEPLNFVTGQNFVMTGNALASPKALTLSVNDNSIFSSLSASSISGLSLKDDGGNLGVFIEDGGNVGIGTNNPAALLSVGTANQFEVSSTGNLTKINNVAYSWPASQAAGSGYVLTNNGSGTLTWGASSGLAVNWSSLQNPTANLALSHGAYTT